MRLFSVVRGAVGTSVCATLLLAGAVANAQPRATQPIPAYDRTLSSYTQREFPEWLKVSGEFRSRVEGRTGFNFQPDNDDAYALFRTRVNIELTPSRWAHVFFQGQDSRVAGMDPGRPMGIFKDPLDVRQAYARLGKADGPVKLVVGRQLLIYGQQRVLGPLDWTNTSRNWDAVKLELGTADARVDLFASSVVVTDHTRRINQPRRGQNVHGAYGIFKKVVPKSTFEPYLLWKTGAVSIWSGGIRLVAMPGTPGLHGFDYQIEAIRQWGTVGMRTQSAYASSLLAGYTIPGSAWKPRFSAEHNYASGERDPASGTRRTFDHILGTNHPIYGIVDILGWQNTRNVRLGFDAKPNRRLHLTFDYFNIRLDSARDALYDVQGRATVRPRAGNTARDVGSEVDFIAAWTVSSQWRAGAGIGVLRPGRYLKENSPGAGQTFPYVFTQYFF